MCPCHGVGKKSKYKKNQVKKQICIMFLVCMVCNITSQSQYDENNLEHFLNPVTYHIQYLNEVLIDISYFLSLLITVKYFNYLPVGCKCCIEYRFIASAVLKCMKIKIIEVVISHNACIVCVIALDIFTRMLILISIFFFVALGSIIVLHCPQSFDSGSAHNTLADFSRSTA